MLCACILTGTAPGAGRGGARCSAAACTCDAITNRNSAQILSRRHAVVVTCSEAWTAHDACTRSVGDAFAQSRHGQSHVAAMRSRGGDSVTSHARGVSIGGCSASAESGSEGNARASTHACIHACQPTSSACKDCKLGNMMASQGISSSYLLDTDGSLWSRVQGYHVRDNVNRRVDRFWPGAALHLLLCMRIVAAGRGTCAIAPAGKL